MEAVNEERRWIIRNNSENRIHSRINENIVKYTKSNRIRWLNHVERIDKRIMHARLKTIRRQGRPRNRWFDAVKKSLQKQTVIRNWRNTT